MPDVSNEDLLAQLGAEVEVKKKAKLTPREERIIAGFEEIQRFVEEHGGNPSHGEDKEIFERIYATRLDQIKKSEECRVLLIDIDHQSLLTGELAKLEAQVEYESDEALLAELGVGAKQENDITNLKHVRSSAEKKAAEEIGSRSVCEDFDSFKSVFKNINSSLKSGLVEAKKLLDSKGQSYMAQISEGDWFIVNGQKAFVAKVSEERNHGFDKNDHRLRVIFDNATESDLLLRSFQKSLYEDEASRRIVPVSAGPLFEGNKEDEEGYKISADTPEGEDQVSGTIYVLRSESELELIANNRDVIHKIGVTGGKVEKRIANAKDDATYLLAAVKVVATYPLFGIDRNKLEKLIHHFFESARLDIEIKDRFGKPVKPREWFLVPLGVIDELVDRIKDGSIESYRYDIKQAALVKL